MLMATENLIIEEYLQRGSINDKGTIKKISQTRVLEKLIIIEHKYKHPESSVKKDYNICL